MGRRAVSIIVMSLVVLAGGLGLAPDAGSQPTFVPAAQATIRPGVQLIVANGQCTANFVYHRGEDRYLGMAAHCASLGGSSDLNGCSTSSRPLGTPVRIGGATRPGTLVYSSWLAMQAAEESDAQACQYNDFALVRIDPADHGRMNPTVPHWGGPTGLAPAGSWPTNGYRGYGNSSLRQGITLLSPMWGWGIGNYNARGWLRQAYTLLPAVPGDSGMGLQTTDGRAAGVLSYLVVLPSVGSLGFTDLNLALGYARAHGMDGLQLAHGDPINPNQLPLGL
jgi:hypothetical protein